MKLYCVFFLMILIPGFSFSQASAGIKIGGSYRKITGINSDFDLGYEAGFFSKAELGKKISLMIELDYSDKNLKWL